MKLPRVILAAGLSTRMGKPKMILPWGKSTIIGTVVSTLAATGLKKIIVVTGGASREIEEVLSGFSQQIVFNPMYENGEMLYSIQTGLSVLPSNIHAALVVLGDQPQMQLTLFNLFSKSFKQNKPN